MYTPEAFKEKDYARLCAFIQQHSFGLLVSQQQGQQVASHIPFLFDETRGEFGILRGHLARANEQWQGFDDSQQALVIFQGPHAYISPSWYQAPLSVPTWNYVAVHAYGTPHILDQPEQVLALLRDQVEFHEAGFAQPWPMALPDNFVSTLMRNIVAFEIPVTRLEGKSKLNQNRSREDRERVISHLYDLPDQDGHAVARLMRELLEDK